MAQLGSYTRNLIVDDVEIMIVALFSTAGTFRGSRWVSVHPTRPRRIDPEPRQYVPRGLSEILDGAAAVIAQHRASCHHGATVHGGRFRVTSEAVGCPDLDGRACPAGPILTLHTPTTSDRLQSAPSDVHV